MRTFHIGGAASRASAVDSVKVKQDGVIRLINLKTVQNKDKNLVAVSRSVELAIADEKVASVSAIICLTVLLSR